MLCGVRLVLELVGVSRCMEIEWSLESGAATATNKSDGCCQVCISCHREDATK